MQAIQDIFSRWPSIQAMADTLDEKSDTVLRWKIRGRIPEHIWPKLIERTAADGDPITAENLLALNAPMKRRGRPLGVRNVVRLKSKKRRAQ